MDIAPRSHLWDFGLEKPYSHSKSREWESGIFSCDP